MKVQSVKGYQPLFKGKDKKKLPPLFPNKKDLSYLTLKYKG